MTGSVLRIGLAVEGVSDREFLQSLAQRVIGDVVSRQITLSFVLVSRRERSPDTIAPLICKAFLDQAIDIVCVHKDADSAQRQPAALAFADAVCAAAAAACALPCGSCLRVVPMRETETWCFYDLDALQRVFGVTRLPPEMIAAFRQPEAIENAKHEVVPARRTV